MSRTPSAGTVGAAGGSPRRRALPLALALLALSGAGGGCAPDPAPDGRDVLARAAAYLWSQQAEDGGWHSATHGIVRGGQAWTPFVLHALLQVPEDVAAPPEGGVERALGFLRAHVDSSGALGLGGPVLEYPVYSTAYGLRVLAAHGAPEDTALVRRMARFLQAQQFTERRGITPEHLAYGAWGFGETTLGPGETGHLDLSHTRRALGALRAAGALDSASADAATRFLRLLQKHPSSRRPQPPDGVLTDSTHYDGGFYASSVSVGVNKAGLTAAGVYGSYATTTADGLLALLAAGHAPDSEPVQAALGWLRAHPGWDEPAGLPPDAPGQWQRVMQFYHLATRAEAYARLGETGWRDDVAALLAARQRPDGSFANPEGAPNKEDDPLLATALAVQALSRALRSP
ncbi:MAG: hypothetical protein R3181_12850 [Rubricoccaceae bacterium]|nr:hypothetical protein [Rubricoccaceae bacterium]